MQSCFWHVIITLPLLQSPILRLQYNNSESLLPLSQLLTSPGHGMITKWKAKLIPTVYLIFPRHIFFDDSTTSWEFINRYPHYCQESCSECLCTVKRDCHVLRSESSCSLVASHTLSVFSSFLFILHLDSSRRSYQHRSPWRLNTFKHEVFTALPDGWSLYSSAAQLTAASSAKYSALFLKRWLAFPMNTCPPWAIHFRWLVAL